MNRTNLVRKILQDRIIAVLRFNRADHVQEVVEALAEGGIRIIEITLTTPGAVEMIRQLAVRDDLIIGVGSALTEKDARGAFDAGAAFYASPICDPGIVSLAIEADRAAMPGALTPTEIWHAWKAGADLVKVFPMGSDGAAMIRAMRGPLPGIPLAPSGGVNDRTAPLLLQAGAAALNVGSWLTHRVNGELDTRQNIRERAEALTAAVKSATE